MRRPRRLAGIQVKTCAFAQIPTAIVGDIIAARAGIRHHQHKTSSAAIRWAPALVVKFSSLQVSPDSQ
jgi:hypothetical protein